MGDRFELQKLLSLYYSKEEVIYVSSLLISWSGSSEEAFSWLNEPIPAFGNMTAIEACEKGLSEHILTYLKQIENGSFA
ncbi:antitoxin Xre/MbcA/ParS toxin-binding domain-containing protein [Shewanella sp. S1-49-MNA-CIBAN-0167]|uniref:MbcA/ParS/Xre antitoxin family protein n=1 Tax=Shewanella sp. S1-49-MNA-CIBAN-0167 TaxID=3140468 RepID=UPI00331E831F